MDLYCLNGGVKTFFLVLKNSFHIDRNNLHFNRELFQQRQFFCGRIFTYLQTIEIHAARNMAVSVISTIEYHFMYPGCRNSIDQSSYLFS